jgi:hypothetical protein
LRELVGLAYGAGDEFAAAAFAVRAQFEHGEDLENESPMNRLRRFPAKAIHLFVCRLLDQPAAASA